MEEGRLNLRMDGGRRVHASFFISETYSNRFSHLRLRRRPIFTFGCKTVEKEGREGEYASFFAARHPFSNSKCNCIGGTANVADLSALRRINGITGILGDFAAPFCDIFHRLGIKTTSVHCTQKRNCESAPSLPLTAAAVPFVARGIKRLKRCSGGDGERERKDSLPLPLFHCRGQSGIERGGQIGEQKREKEAAGPTVTEYEARCSCICDDATHARIPIRAATHLLDLDSDSPTDRG